LTSRSKHFNNATANPNRRRSEVNIFVCLKQVPDTETKVRIKSDGSGIETDGIKWVMNPYDEFAVEEALKLRDRLADGSTVTALTLGPKTRVTEALRTALAMGADNAAVIDAPDNLDNYSTAKALAAALKADSAGIVFTGKQAIDDDGSQVTQLIAEFLGAGHSNVATKFEISGDKNSCTVEREVDGGAREIVSLQLPAVVGANKGLNTPRYASLPGIMKAKKKEIRDISLSSLSVGETDRKISLSGFELPPPRPAGRFIDGDAASQATALVKLLREESKVI
jgi:electron transfer flavoprotein beta subunit